MADGIQIERSKHAQEFVIIGNAVARDSRLSFRARGLHHHLLSLPPGWRVTTADLAKEHPEGREAIRTALNELIAHGYVTKVKRQDERGRWSTVMTVHDKPQSAARDDPAAEDGFPGVGQPDVGGLGAKPKTVTENSKDGPVDLASRRARAKAASATLTVQDAIAAIRRAATIEYGSDEADEISDGDALGLYFTYVQNRRPRDLVAYLGKIFGDAPHLDALLAGSGWACPRCQKWETGCKCPAA